MLGPHTFTGEASETMREQPFCLWPSTWELALQADWGKRSQLDTEWDLLGFWFRSR